MALDNSPDNSGIAEVPDGNDRLALIKIVINAVRAAVHRLVPRPAHLSADATVIDHAKRLLPAIQMVRDDTRRFVQVVVEQVFADGVLQKEFTGSDIRYTSQCGEVAREVLYALNEDPDQISMMAIGDVTLPPWAKKTAEKIFNRACDHHKKFSKEFGFGYDIAAQGVAVARRAVFDFFDSDYGFPPELKEKFIKNSAFTGGGMQALDLFATAMIEKARKGGKRNRFISPENSFSTWHTIVDRRSVGAAVADVHKLPTQQKNLLHLTPEDVDAFYKDHPVTGNSEDSWCITPIGNPSGTKMKPLQLVATCEAIIRHNPNAVILLDSVYVRTLTEKQARALMAGILSNQTIINRLVFIESFSKTHGVPRLRLGMFFSANDSLFGEIQNQNMALTAGQGDMKSALALAFAEMKDKEKKIFKRLKMFWAAERKGLYAHLIKSGRFNDIFDEDQSHICEEDIEGPLGLYVFLKLKDGVSAQQVLLRTSCLGIETKFTSGKYIRFSVGKITKPTYAKYAQETAPQTPLPT